MKKSKLSIALVTSFIASMALAACGSTVTKDNDKIVDFKGYGDEELSIKIDEIYQEYMEGSSGISKYYDQVMEVLIRHAFQKDPTGRGNLAGIKKNYNQILSEAKDDVKAAKSTAKTNSETNGTSYKTEWQAVLNEKGVKDEEQLLQYFIYQKEKSEIEDWYFDQNEDELRKEYLGVNANGEATAKNKVSSRFPYHVRHILIKVEDGAKDFVRGTISADQAKLLSSTVELLAQQTLTFGEVAKKKSEDSSNTNYGDVGLMTNAITSGKLGMVNEFQLGIYAYDAIQYHEDDKTKASEITGTVAKAIGLDRHYAKDKTQDADTVKKYFLDRGVNEIPYSVFKELGDVAELETNYATGLPIEDSKAAIYPRNLLWNRYLNNHGIFVITNGKRLAPTELGSSYAREAVDQAEGTYYGTGKDDYIKYDKDQSEASNKLIDYSALPGFRNKEDANLRAKKADWDATKRVLADESGNVIIGVRSEYGIHLMVVQRSVYDWSLNGTSLEEYYTTLIPTDKNYPGVKEGGNPKTTYVNMITSTNTSDYISRADTIRSAIKGFDSTYDYRLYEELIADPSIDKSSTSTTKMLGAIDNYIDVQRNKNLENQDEGIEEVWQTYVELLESQDFYRHDLDRIVPEGCKIAFTTTSYDASEFEEGGHCYVK